MVEQLISAASEEEIDFYIERAFLETYRLISRFSSRENAVIPELNEMVIDVVAESTADMRSSVAMETYEIGFAESHECANFEEYIELVDSGEIDKELGINDAFYWPDMVRIALVNYMAKHHIFYSVRVSQIQLCYINQPIVEVW